MPKWRSKDFLELQKAWYERLAQEEFDDCEELINGELRLIRNKSNPGRRADGPLDKLSREHREIYYSLLSEHSNLEKFDHRVEKLIIFRLSEGANIKEISEELKELGDPRCTGYRQTIRFIIRKFEDKRGIRSWKPEQMKIQTWKKKAPTR